MDSSLENLKLSLYKRKAISKLGFLSKVKADPSFTPQAY